MSEVHQFWAHSTKWYSVKNRRSMYFLTCTKKYSNEQVIGIYDLGGSPMYVINDLEITKKITSKDFDHFINHRGTVDKNVEPILGRSMFMSHGQDWKDLRSITSPAFTGSKMRQMMQLLNECTSDLCENIKMEMANNDKIFDIKDLFKRYVTNTIASSAFGFKINSLKDRNNEFYKRGASAASFEGFQGAKMFAFLSIPKFMKLFKIPFMLKKDVEYFRSMIRDNMKYREENNIRRPDMINIMMEAKKGSLQHDTKNDDIGFATVQESDYGKSSTKHLKLDEDDIVAQCMIFIFGGLGAVPTTQCFMAHELALNTEIQDKLFDEIKKMNNQLAGQPLTYEALQTMKYLDMVVCESLRRWSIAPFSDRSVNKPYVIELKNGKTINLKVGDGLWIPIVGYHMDPKYWTNPQKFDPERFSDENKHNIVPGSYIPFSIGPRNCVGSRYALMAVKSLMYHLILNFRLEVCEKTVHPLKLKTNSPVVDADFWLKLRSRT